MSSGADTVNKWIKLQNSFEAAFLGMKHQRDKLRVDNDHLREQIEDLTIEYKACKEECAKEKEKMREFVFNLKENLRGHLESEHNQLQHIVNHLEEECGKEKEKMRKVLELTLQFEKEFAGFNSGPAKNVSEFRAFLTRIITSYLTVLRQTYYIKL